jgi:putative membrane protein
VPAHVAESNEGANPMLAYLNSLPLLSHGDGPWDSEWWWLWRLGMFLFWILVIAVVFFSLRRWGWGWRHHEPDPLERARGILAERFARGEISAEEYRERLGQL